MAEVLKGQWYLPETENNSIAGELSISDNGHAVLNLEGSFWNFGELPKENVLTVIGITDKYIVSLFDVSQAGVSITNFMRVRLKPRYGILKGRYSDSATYEYKRVMVSSKHLIAWVNKHLKVSGFNDDSDEVRIGKKEEKVCSFEWNTYSITVYSSVSYTVNSQNANFHAAPYILIESKIPLTIDEYFTAIVQLRDYITLTLQQEISLESISAHSNDYQNIEIWDKIIFNGVAPASCKEIDDFHRILLCESDIHNDANVIFNRYAETYQQNQNTYRLMMEALNSVDLDLRNATLIYSQMLESASRILHRGSSYTDTSTHIKLQEILASAIPPDTSPDFKNKIVNTLRYVNEPSLRKRLKMLMSSIGSAVIDQFIDSDQRDEFIDHCTQLRNYYTHQHDEMPDVLKDIHKTVQIIARMRIMSEATILLIMGHDVETIQTVLPRRFGVPPFILSIS